MPHEYLAPTKARREYQIPWKWSYRWLLSYHVGAWNQTWVSIRTSLSHFFAYSIFFKKTNKEKNFHILVSRVSKDFLNYSCQKTLMLCFTKN